MFEVLFPIYIFGSITCSGFDSSEVSLIENAIYNPLYEAIVFNDIADILGELDNNGNSPLGSESGSDENIEDLLTEYQHYLEKAHQQRKGYFDKNKSKNKVPHYRHDNYVKNKPTMGKKYDSFYYEGSPFSIGSDKFPMNYLNKNPVDILVPLNSRLGYIKNNDITTAQPKLNDELFTYRKILSKEKQNNQETHYGDGAAVPNSKQCICKNGKLPCNCGCSRCYMPLEFKPKSNNGYKTTLDSEKDGGVPYLRFNDQSNEDINKNTELYNDKLSNEQEISDNIFNIRVKVEIQLPKSQDFLKHNCNNHTHRSDFDLVTDTAKEILPSNVNIPFPYFNYPLPLEMLGYKKASNSDKIGNIQTHKVLIHKRKKQRPSNSNKKHRKRLMSFQNINLDFHQQAQSVLNINDNSNKSDINQGSNNTIKEKVNLTVTFKQNPVAYNESRVTVKAINETFKTSTTQPARETHLKANTSSKENGTDDIRKLENIIDTDVEDIKGNYSTVTEKQSILRKKRHITENKNSMANNSSQRLSVIFIARKNSDKSSDKQLSADTELLYWPDKTKFLSVDNSKNITSIILEREHRKAKVNMSKEAIRHNHTKALEKAIFGEVDWNDVDTVAPVFMSFVGKYIRGILTFCSDSICHSMKCEDKVCVHRTCGPDERFNHRGHCVGSNNTESVASMESIMDLPSNIAFEIVDILQDKMEGKLFGKVTLCMSSKCISFASMKKMFLKSKCLIKDLDSSGHCPNMKNLKNT